MLSGGDPCCRDIQLHSFGYMNQCFRWSQVVCTAFFRSLERKISEKSLITIVNVLQRYNFNVGSYNNLADVIDAEENKQ
jgi:hypothetical protein